MDCTTLTIALTVVRGKSCNLVPLPAFLYDLGEQLNSGFQAIVSKTAAAGRRTTSAEYLNRLQDRKRGENASTEACSFALLPKKLPVLLTRNEEQTSSLADEGRLRSDFNGSGGYVR